MDVSINDHSDPALLFKLYPNPFASEAVLEFDYDASKRYGLCITDNLGQTLRKQPVTNGRVHIAREQLASGIYFIQLSIPNGPQYTSKLIVE